MTKANPTSARGFLRAGRRRVAADGQRARVATAAKVSEHRLDVQGLRAVAVLLVLAFHGGLGVHGGFIGVDVFFVISGFVITAMLQREWQARGRIDFARFYLRRFRRLVPALALVVTATLLASTLLLSPEGTLQVAAKTAIGALLISANAVIAHVTGGYFDPPAHANPLLNTWSLSVEEQFYVVFPALLAAAWWWQARARARAHAGRSAWSFAPLAMTALVATGSFALATAGSAQALPAADGLFGFYSPLTRAWEFAAGSAVALLAARGAFAARAVHPLPIAIAGALGLVASVLLISRATPFPGPWTVLPVAATVLLIVAGSNSGGNAVSRCLSARPLTTIGDWSYSLYLWHWPLIALAQKLWPGSARASFAALLLSFPLAIASYRWVEQPLRLTSRARHGEGRSRSPSWKRLAAATIAAPVALALVLHVAAEAWFGNDALRAERAALALRPTGLDDGRGCSQRAPVEAKNLAACRWNSEAPGAPIYLVGDSNAQQFSDALIAAGTARGRPVVTLTTAGCPFVDAWLERDAEPGFGAECRRAFTSALAWLKAQRPGTVLVASVDRYWRDADYRIRGISNEGGSDAARDDREAPQRNAAALNEGLARAVRSLQGAGHAVTLIQTIPQFVSHEHPMQHGQCRGWEVLAHACERPFGSMSLSDADALQHASRQGLAAVAANTGATLADLRGVFCAGGTCTTRSARGEDLYMPDGYHLNRAGSARLAGEFAALLGNGAGRANRVALQRGQ